MEKTDKLSAGQAGLIAANIKEVRDAKVGDTVTEEVRPTAEALPGFKDVLPMVFCGLYPVASEDYDHLKEALSKLKLSDAAPSYEPETSVALSFGFRCGFLGLLHMEIEWGLDSAHQRLPAISNPLPESRTVLAPAWRAWSRRRCSSPQCFSARLPP